MGATKPMLPAVEAALGRGQTILTANQRAARTLARSYDRAMQAAGRTLWTPAPILTLDAWAHECWHRLVIAGLEERLLLNRAQEHAVWRSLIADDAELRGMRPVDSLAKMAADAWRALCVYNGLPRLREIGVSTDTLAFERWAMAFDRRCRREGLLSEARLWGELEAAVQRGQLAVPDAGFGLVGFDHLPPAAAQMLETVRRAGYPVDVLAHEADGAESWLAQAATEADELQAAAGWACRLVQADAEAHIAIIVPALEQRRGDVERALREAFADMPGGEQAYELSLGRPLGQSNLAVTAIRLLRWTLEPLPLEQVSELLLAPSLHGSDALAEFDGFVLRETQLLRTEVSLEWMIERLRTKGRSAECAALAHHLRAMQREAVTQRMAGEHPAERPYSEWAEGFAKVLQAAGWPGDWAADSVGYQEVRRWQSVLDELCTLDFDAAKPAAAEALRALERLAGEAIFAPESHDAPIQVMGPLEAAGQAFDALWFIGAGELEWPVPRSTSPLLPWHMQRELRMPGADAVAEKDLAASVTNRLARSASRVVFSYAATTGDAKQKASHVIRMLGLEETTTEALSGGPTVRATIELEAMADDLALPPLPDEVHRGGAAVLQAQAACGFRAFAEHRLWSAELEARDPGMNAMERGSLVHAVMEHFWREVQNQVRLRTMQGSERERVLDAAIAAGLAETSRRMRPETTWEAAYLAAQRDRLRALLGPWLELEAQRPEFAVREMETSTELRIGPLRLQVRVDRIDETEGGRLIIDYKTGAAKPSDWLTDRPDAPQLPMYAMLAEDAPLGGVAFALLRAGEDLELTGYAVDETVLPKLVKMSVPTLEDQVAEWRHVLTHLAEDFAAGVADVAPKQYPHTCKHCGQRLLCRLDPALLDADSDVDLDDTEPSCG